MNIGKADCNERDAVSVQMVKDSWVGGCRKSIGSALVDEMLLNPERATILLAHPDPNVRSAAISLLEIYWEADKSQEFADKCESIGGHDPDPNVRGLALSVLGVCYRRIPSRRIARMLANVVGNEAEPKHARVGAYFGLCYFHNLQPRWEGQLAGSPFRIPEDVNWAMVNADK